MRTLPNPARPDSDSSPQGDGWDTSTNNGSSLGKEQIKQANRVPIVLILKSYGVKLEQHTKSIMCPFSGLHKNGKDRSPSFTIFPNTNSFFCFGCRTGNTPVDFVAKVENIGPYKAAEHILSREYDGTFNGVDGIQVDYSERLEALINFSNFIRNKMISANPDTILFLEEICAALDNLNTKYKKNIDNATIISMIDRLKRKVEEKLA